MAPALHVSGPAQRSLTLRPTCSPSRLSDPLHQRLRRLRFLCRRSDCYRVERTSSRAGLSPAVDQRLSRRTITSVTSEVAHHSPAKSLMILALYGCGCEPTLQKTV